MKPLFHANNCWNTWKICAVLFANLFGLFSSQNWIRRVATSNLVEYHVFIILSSQECDPQPGQVEWCGGVHQDAEQRHSAPHHATEVGGQVHERHPAPKLGQLCGSLLRLSQCVYPHGDSSKGRCVSVCVRGASSLTPPYPSFPPSHSPLPPSLPPG